MTTRQKTVRRFAIQSLELLIANIAFFAFFLLPLPLPNDPEFASFLFKLLLRIGLLICAWLLVSQSLLRFLKAKSTLYETSRKSYLWLLILVLSFIAFLFSAHYLRSFEAKETFSIAVAAIGFSALATAFRRKESFLFSALFQSAFLAIAGAIPIYALFGLRWQPLFFVLALAILPFAKSSTELLGETSSDSSKQKFRAWLESPKALRIICRAALILPAIIIGSLAVMRQLPLSYMLCLLCLPVLIPVLTELRKDSPSKELLESQRRKGALVFILLLLAARMVPL